MWPKRKIQLVASAEAHGLEGVRTLLKGIGLEFIEATPTPENDHEPSSERWFEKPLEAAYEEIGPVTELVFWPEVTESDAWRRKASALGIQQHSIDSFLHNLLRDERILLVAEPSITIEELPLLGHLLCKAGFEPNILWPAGDGTWKFVRKQGIHWIIPGSWFSQLLGSDLPVTEHIQLEKSAAWVIRENKIDFYRGQPGLNYLGSLPRWPERTAELEACQTIGLCLDLGVSWLDIKMALNSVWDNITTTDNLRGNVHDFGWNAGTSGKTIPA